MRESKPIKVMIVDDHPIVRTGLTAVLHVFDDLDLVGEAAAQEQAVVGERRAVEQKPWPNARNPYPM